MFRDCFAFMKAIQVRRFLFLFFVSYGGRGGIGEVVIIDRGHGRAVVPAGIQGSSLFSPHLRSFKK